jgi:hypothetical protein
MVMGDNDVNYINPAASNDTQRRVYEKHPEREFRLKQDVVVPAGTVFCRAPLERGGADHLEGIVELGTHATATLNLPLRVALIDATEWFEEVTGEKSEKADNP